jgi:segregation and condensation protein A
MDQHAATRAGEPDAACIDETVPAPAAEDGQAGREGGSPHLTLDGFSGPLETLLTLARAQRINLSAISLTALLDQLTAALQQAPKRIPLGQQGDWVVMAAWLVQLRTRLLLPADAPAQQDAVVEADAFRTRFLVCRRRGQPCRAERRGMRPPADRGAGDRPAAHDRAVTR